MSRRCFVLTMELKIIMDSMMPRIVTKRYLGLITGDITDVGDYELIFVLTRGIEDVDFMTKPISVLTRPVEVDD
jgi:hypothetical protein